MGETVWSHILIRCLPQYTDELIVDKELCKTYSTWYKMFLPEDDNPTREQ